MRPVPRIARPGGRFYRRRAASPKGLLVIAARLKQSGIQTNILTNGLETVRETIAVMKEVGISAVGMSLDGLATTHDYIRRRAGSYEAVMKSIDLFQNHQVPLNIITTVNASNINELEPLFHVLKERGGRILATAADYRDGQGERSYRPASDG